MDRRDAAGVACLFTPGGEYITGAGAHLRGRQAISQLVEKAAPAATITLVEGPSAECDAELGQFSFGWSVAEPSGGARHGRMSIARAGTPTSLVDGVFSSCLSVFAYQSSVARLFQGVAAVPLGSQAFTGGMALAALGALQVGD